MLLRTNHGRWRGSAAAFIDRRLALAVSLALHLLLALLLVLRPASPPVVAKQPRIIAATLLAPAAQSQAVVPTTVASTAPSSPVIAARRPEPTPAQPRTAKPVRRASPAPAPTAATATDSATPAPQAVAAPPQSAPAADSGGVPAARPPDAEELDDRPIAYLLTLTRVIRRSLKYPWHARQYRQQGDAIVRMHLRRDGTVLSATLVQSSGYSALDEEAREVVLRVRRFPPFPADYRPSRQEFEIDQPVTFRSYTQ